MTESAPAASGDLGAVLDALEDERLRARASYRRALVRLCLAAPVVVGPLAAVVWIAAAPPGGTGLRHALQVLAGPHAAAVLVAALAWVPASGLVALRAWHRLATWPREAYLAAFKARAFTAVCRAHFPGITYAPDAGIHWRVLDDSGLFPHASDEYRSEDGFAGRHGATDVHFAEAIAQRERTRGWGENRRTELETYFRGIVFSADFHKHFHSTTRLLPRDAEAVSRPDEAPATFEDPAFDAIFQVRTTDQIDVRYVLSPALLERLTALAGTCPGVRALFEGGRLLLLLPGTRDRFEPAFDRDARDRAQLDAFVADVRACLDIVEALDLNTRIWSKD